MNSKMTTNSELSKTRPKKTKNKNELSKQLEQEQIHRNRDHMESYQQGSRRGRMGEKIQGIRSINGRYKIDGEVKNSIGNVGDKELICMTHGHELSWGNADGRRSAGQRE